MKVVHLMLCGPFTDGFAYQENELIARHVEAGHEVTMLASTEHYGPSKAIEHAKPGESRTQSNVRLVRLPYIRYLPTFLASKLRIYSEVSRLLSLLQPDIIFFHGLCSWELITVQRYKSKNPKVKFFVDCHEDFNNSARTWVSKWLLHYAYYRSILQFCLPSIEKVLCVTVESLDFARDFYGVANEMLELYPIGGNVLEDTEYLETRKTVRTELGAEDSDIIFVQSGKIDITKNLGSALRAFTNVKDPRLKYYIAGKISPEVFEDVTQIMDADPRIVYIGWISPERLRRFFCGADVFVQPFGQTVSTQMSICCRCAIIAQDLPSHRALFCNNGLLTSDEFDLGAAFQYVSKNASQLESMQNNSAEFARNNLDYRSLASRVFI